MSNEIHKVYAFGNDYRVSAPDEQTAREFVAYCLGIETFICDCGRTYWGREGELQHARQGHHSPTLEQVDGYWATADAHRKWVMDNCEAVTE